jgi:hypothetical protein
VEEDLGEAGIRRLPCVHPAAALAVTGLPDEKRGVAADPGLTAQTGTKRTGRLTSTRLTESDRRTCPGGNKNDEVAHEDGERDSEPVAEEDEEEHESGDESRSDDGQPPDRPPTSPLGSGMGPSREYIVFCAAGMNDRALAELSPAESARQLGPMWRETSAEAKARWAAQEPSATPKAPRKKHGRGVQRRRRAGPSGSRCSECDGVQHHTQIEPKIIGVLAIPQRMFVSEVREINGQNLAPSRDGN